MQMWGADGTPLPVAATRWRDMEWSKAAPRRLDRLRREISTPLYKLSTCFLVWCKMAADNSGSVTIREIMTAQTIADAAPRARAFAVLGFVRRYCSAMR